MSDENVNMAEAHRASKEEISKKLKSLLKMDYEIEGSFKLSPVGTLEMQSLRQAQEQQVEVPNNIGYALPAISRFDVTCFNKGEFFGLQCEPSHFYARNGYKDLYNCIADAWRDKNYRVTLIGNAGTGKSWFQIYVLKQLMDDKERKYDFVIRQVASSFYLIDLSDAQVFLWEATGEHIKFLSVLLQKTLYFFEPDDDDMSRPLAVSIPSLSTLSPCEERIKQYSKRFFTPFYFWPWAVEEMWALVLDANLDLDFDSFFQRYKMYGGILRNVLGEDTRAKTKLQARLKKIDLDVLTSVALNVDAKEKGDNISGYLICYDNRLVGDEDRFATMNLEYTSVFVEEEVAKRLHSKPVESKMATVLKRMDGEMLDLSGKYLEDVAMQLLSEGKIFSWLFHEVGDIAQTWSSFPMKKREIRRTSEVNNCLLQHDLILAPTDLSFPVVDFLFSQDSQDMDLPVSSFQCTWQDKLSFTVRALYNLRCRLLKIDDDKQLAIYFVTPGKEDNYVRKQKNAFLDGSVDQDLCFSKNVYVEAAQLRTMWANTTIFVVMPKQGWKDTITNWLETHEKMED